LSATRAWQLTGARVVPRRFFRPLNNDRAESSSSTRSGVTVAESVSCYGANAVGYGGGQPFVAVVQGIVNMFTAGLY
jgi:hypothetical protein